MFLCLSLKLLFKESVVTYFQENRVRFCSFWNHHFTLKESMSGLINEGRENDILVFWPEIE